jgi:hypothetical protein
MSKPHQPTQSSKLPYPDKDLREIIPPHLAHFLDYNMSWEDFKRFLAVVMTRYSAMAIVLKEMDIHVPDQVIDACFTPLYMEVLADIHTMGEIIECSFPI